MPIFAAMVVTLFTQLFAFLGFMLAKKVALVLAGAAATLAVLGILYAAMRAVVIPLAANLFSTSYGAIFGLAFPPIAGTCILAIPTVWVACALYSYQRTTIRSLTSG